MNKINIKSFIKVDDKYIDFFDFDGEVPDPDYIEGAIELTINGVKLIDKSMYDYIDDLWSYFSEGLASVFEGKDFSTFFPDQPIEVKFEGGNSISNLSVSVNCHEKISVNVNKEEFVSVMKVHAENFFDKLQEIVPDSEKTCYSAKSYLNKIII